MLKWIPGLGEDVRDEDRQRQDAEWAEAVADGRAHVSHREMAMLNAPQICMAIADYRLIETMVRYVECHFNLKDWKYGISPLRYSCA